MRDSEKLYRLACAVGTSLDVTRNCERFLAELAELEGLSHCSVWLHHRLLVGDEGTVGESAERAIIRVVGHPASGRRNLSIPHDHGVPAALSGQRAFSEALPSRRLQGVLESGQDGGGKAAVIALGELGFLVMVDGSRRRPFARTELLALQEVMDLFAGSLSGSLAYRAQSREVLRRKHLEAEIRHREEYFRALIANSLDLILVLDYDSTIEFASPSSRLVLGAEPGELEGRNLLELVRPDELSTLMEAVRGPLLRPGLGPSFELHFRRADDRWRVLDVRTNNLLASSSVGGIILNCRDVTESRRYREALRTSEERYALAVRGSNDGIWDWDLINDEIHLSPRWGEMIGLEAPPDSPEGWFELVHPDDLPGLRAAIDGHLAGLTQHVEHEYRIRTGSGRWLWVLCRGVAVRDPGGRPTRIAGSQSDISETMRQQHELEEARQAAVASSRARGEFLANMSHEIRTPMNGVIGMASLLLEMPLEAEQRECVETIRSSGEALLAIVNDVLDFSKIESGRIEIEWTPFSAARCVEGAFDVVAPTAAGKGLELVYLVDPSVPEVLLGDAGKIRQVLINLVGNAVKFTGVGHVSVRVGVVEGASARVLLRFDVEDTGVGVAADALPRLFEPFTQADPSTTRRFGGTGLGLTISRRLVEALGGRIWLESEEGSGSTFSFTVVVGVQSDVVPSKAMVNVSALTGRSVVVHDPSELAATQLESMLAAWGVATRRVSDPGVLARLAERGSSTEVVVAGYREPAEVRSLAERAARSAMAVVLVGPIGSSRSEVAVDGEPACVRHLAKPLKERSLAAALAAAVAGSAPAEGRQESAAVSERAPAAAATGLRVLVADDNRINRALTVRVLERLGHLAEAVADGEEAVAAVRRSAFDCVLMDLQMPVLDGIEASRRILATEDLPQRPRIIALTAHAGEHDHQRCLDAGMNGFLAKPVRLGDLQAALEDVEGGRPDRAETGPPEVLDEEQLRRMGELGRPGFVDQVVSIFTATGRDEIQTVRDLVLDGETGRAAEVLHRFIGSCLSLGARRLDLACRHLAHHLADGEVELALEDLEEVDRLFDQVVERLHSRSG